MKRDGGGMRREKKRKELPLLVSLFLYARSRESNARNVYSPRERVREREEGRDHFSRVPNPTHPPLPDSLLSSLIVAVGVMMRKRRGRGETTLAAGEKEGT